MKRIVAGARHSFMSHASAAYQPDVNSMRIIALSSTRSAGRVMHELP
jgi:hypothetical protein